MAYEDKRPAPPKQQSVSLAERSRLVVSGVEEVESFDEGRIVMRTVLGELVVTGSGLHVGRLSLETGELTVEGSISGLNYGEERAEGSLWSRLFG